MNVAIISPNKNAYSETFIQAHRNIKANVFFYYGGYVPKYLDGYGYIGPKMNIIFRGWNFFSRKFLNSSLNTFEKALKKSFKQNKIDVVLAEYGPTGVAVFNTCKSSKIPLVTIFHGFDASEKNILQKYQKQYQDLFFYSKRIIAVSKKIKDTLIGLGCPPKKIIYSPCAPNDLFISVKPTFLETRSFVAIGRFVNKKAPYYTILAIKKVVEKYPNVKLYFGGDGELFETCKNIVKAFKLEDNIKLLGKIKPDEYRSILAKVTGFLQHSITSENGDSEGTPVAILEANAAGIPVIATKHGGIPDIIIDRKTGFLVEEHDVEGMAEKIIELIENPELAKKLGEAGKKRIKENFSMEIHLKTIEDALRI